MDSQLVFLGLLLARVCPVCLLLLGLTRGIVGWPAALSLGLAMVAGLSVGQPLVAPPSADAVALLLLLARELCLGSLVGLALMLPIAAFGWAASFAERGQAPATPRAGPIATLYALGALFLCLSLGAHRSLVIGLHQSLSLAPPGQGRFDSAAFGLGVVRLVGEAMALAVALGLPLLCAWLVLEGGLALLQRVFGPAARHALGPALARPLSYLIAAGLLWPAVSQAPVALRVGLRLLRELTLRSAS